MTAHVFVVSQETFPIHLKYMFAWTWAWEDWHENLWMISDVASCREWDKILFFVTWVGFFGSFKVKKEYFFNENWEKYMDFIDKKWKNKIIKRLTNRILIESDEVYSYGVSEWDVLDNISNLPKWKNSNIQDFLWSLLYRKLDWNRGCTPIFDYEYDFILKIIKRIEWNKLLNWNYIDFCNWEIIEIWKHDLYKINNEVSLVQLKDYKEDYYRTIEEKIIAIKESWLEWETSSWKLRTQWSCELELELFFSAYWNTNTKQWKEISNVIWNNITYFWTQVVCSFWAKRIDILTISEDNIIRIIELKDKKYYDWIIDDQLNYYLSWVDQYIKKDEKVIEPVIVINKTDWLDYSKIENKVIDLVKTYKIKSKVLPLKIFFWDIENWTIKFNLFK